MRIAVISNFFPPDFVGGAEIYAYRVAKELVKLGIEVNVITSTSEKRDVIELDGLRIYRVTKTPPALKITGNFLGYNFNPWSYTIKATLEKIKPDLIHIHNIHTTVMLYPLIRFLNSPVVFHVHDHWPICYAGALYDMKRNIQCDDDCEKCAFHPGFRTIGSINLRFRKKLLTKIEKKVSLFITPSNYLRQKILEKNFTVNNKVMHIPLGIDLEEFSPEPMVPHDSHNILFIGRMASYKNPNLIVKLLPNILDQVECKYQIIGKGPEIERVKELSKKLGVAANVEILGGLDFPTLIQCVKRADVLVVPSLSHENSPVVIYEAQACGLPAIVSSLGGAKELINEGKSGFAIDPNDEKGWTEGILKILMNNDLRKKMGIESRKKAEQEFDIKKNANRMLDIFKGLTNA